MAKEATITKRVKAYLRDRPGVWFVKFVGSPYSRGGIPDLLVCYRGRFVGIELKRDDKGPKSREPTDRQRYEMEKIVEAGGVAGVATSVEEVKQLLDKMESENP